MVVLEDGDEWGTKAIAELHAWSYKA